MACQLATGTGRCAEIPPHCPAQRLADPGNCDAIAATTRRVLRPASATCRHDWGSSTGAAPCSPGASGRRGGLFQGETRRFRRGTRPPRQARRHARAGGDHLLAI